MKIHAAKHIGSSFDVRKVWNRLFWVGRPHGFKWHHTRRDQRYMVLTLPKK